MNNDDEIKEIISTSVKWEYKGQIFDFKEEAEQKRDIENHPVIKAFHDESCPDIFAFKVENLEDVTVEYGAISKFAFDRRKSVNFNVSLFNRHNCYAVLKNSCCDASYKVSICPIKEVLKHAELHVDRIYNHFSSDNYLIDIMLDQFYDLIKDHLRLYPNLFLIYRYERLMLDRRIAKDITKQLLRANTSED